MEAESFDAEQASLLNCADDDGRPETLRGAVALIGFFVIFLGFAAFARLDAAVVAPGVVIVSGSRQTLQHGEGGVISRLAVIEGQHVQRGDVLLELSSPELLAEERSLFAQVIDLQAQRASLTAETMNRQTLETPPEWDALDATDRAAAETTLRRYRISNSDARARSEFEERIRGLQSEIVSNERQQTLLGEELVGVRSLAARGFAPLTRVRALERTLAELEGQRGNLRSQVSATRENRVAELRRIEAQLANTLPQLARARQQLERMRLRAPVDGEVVNLSVNTLGAVIGAGERVLDIVPENQPLVIEAQVRPEDADDLAVGLPTEVRITAFTGRRMPIVHGAVGQISADRLEDQRTGQPYFRAEITVPPSELRRAAARSPGAMLRAGLPAQVVIPTRPRTALQYLLEPLGQAFWQSFREN